MDQNIIRKLKKDIVFETNLRGFDLTFHSTWGLFSPREIDGGTLLLIKNLEIKPTDKILDLGCGYGTIGIAAAKLAPKGEAHLIDKDFVAIEYAKKNVKENNLSNCKVYLSNGFDQVEQNQFDVICSNIPANIGKELLWIILSDTEKYLKPGGKFYIVTIAGLKEFMKRNLNDIFGNYEKLEQAKGYSVAAARKTPLLVIPSDPASSSLSLRVHPSESNDLAGKSRNLIP